MRLTIFGATGGTGLQLAAQALDQGHEVTAVVRDPSRLTVTDNDRLRVVTADVSDPVAIAPAIDGADAVITALGTRGRGPTTLCGDAGKAIIEAMGKAGVRRLLMVSASGLVRDAGDGMVIRYVAKPILGRVVRHHFEDLTLCEEEIRASDLDWTIVRPPQLIDKEPTGEYRTAVDVNVRHGRKIARSDLAGFMLGLVPDRSSVGKHVFVAY
jgi:putative NADH-flavin reductase